MEEHEGAVERERGGKEEGTAKYASLEAGSSRDGGGGEGVARGPRG